MLYASLRLASTKIPKQTPCQLLLWCWVKYHDQKQLIEKGLKVLDGCPYWLEGRGSRSRKLADYISIPAQEAVGAEWTGVALPPRPGSSSSKAASPNSQTVPPRYHPVLDGKKAKKHSKVLSISVGAQLFPTQVSSQLVIFPPWCLPFSSCFLLLKMRGGVLSFCSDTSS